MSIDIQPLGFAILDGHRNATVYSDEDRARFELKDREKQWPTLGPYSLRRVYIGTEEL